MYRSLVISHIMDPRYFKANWVLVFENKKNKKKTPNTARLLSALTSVTAALTEWCKAVCLSFKGGKKKHVRQRFSVSIRRLTLAINFPPLFDFLCSIELKKLNSECVNQSERCCSCGVNKNISVSVYTGVLFIEHPNLKCIFILTPHY